MKNIFILLILFGNYSFLLAQVNKVSFDNYRFRVNNNLFFPIGWYGGSHKDFYLMKRKGVNVVLQYWAAVIKDYWKDYSSFHSDSWDERDSSLYKKYITKYLDDAEKAGLKVFVELPAESVPFNNSGYGQHLMNESFISYIVKDDSIRNHSALLGWYQADEPEGNRKTVKITQKFLVYRYKLIKSLDPKHPVLVVFYDPNAILKKFPIRKGRFYDVAMLDVYPMRTNETFLYQNTWWTRNLFKIFRNNFYASTYPDSGAMIMVEQGYGYNNPINKDFRDPPTTEIYYHAFTPIFLAQDTLYGNLGGIMFWDFDDANSNCRTNVNNFIQYFTQNNLGEIIDEDNLYKYQGTTDLTFWPLRILKRYYNKAYYLFTYNDGTSYIRNYSVFINGVGNNVTCEELNHTGNFSNVSLIKLGNGNQRLIDNWLPLEVKIYKIIP